MTIKGGLRSTWREEMIRSHPLAKWTNHHPCSPSHRSHFETRRSKNSTSHKQARRECRMSRKESRDLIPYQLRFGLYLIGAATMSLLTALRWTDNRCRDAPQRRLVLHVKELCASFGCSAVYDAHSIATTHDFDLALLHHEWQRRVEGWEVVP